MRQNWGKYQKLGAYLNVYIIQGLLMYIITLPIIIIADSNTENYIDLITYFGVGIWFIGLLIESISDFQLLRFKINMKNKDAILKEGMWGISRHPNYFGEVLVWLGIAIIALPVSFWAIISPVILILLLRFVSGVPLIEIRYKDNNVYQEYKENTSVFIPKLFG
jgi:steroid 5-alpha reductase family enzyme